MVSPGLYLIFVCPLLTAFFPPVTAEVAIVASPEAAGITQVARMVMEVRGGLKPARGSKGKNNGKKISNGNNAGNKLGPKASPPVHVDDDDDDDDEQEEEWGSEEDEDWMEEEEEFGELAEEREGKYYESGRSGGSRQRNEWHYADRRRRLAARRRASHGMADLFKGAAKITSSSVGKVAGLFQPNKYVSLREVLGVWKVKQKITEPGGEVERCEATLEIRKDGTVVTFFEGKELVSEFLFKERQWPRSCIIEFEARAFQGPYDREPQPKFYKGYVRRSLMNAGSVRLEGKIYDVQGTFFWRQKRQVGKFRAVKR